MATKPTAAKATTAKTPTAKSSVKKAPTKKTAATSSAKTPAKKAAVAKTATKVPAKTSRTTPAKKSTATKPATKKAVEAASPKNNEFVEVTTAAGKVRGLWRVVSTPGGEATSAAFLGIPFAEAPVGPLRFEAPVPKAPWKGVLSAIDYGATAQRGDPGITLIPEPSVPGESTLNVNVFTPSPKTARKGSGLPVLVYIHGGGFTAGSPASPWYDGRAFNRDGVVTVSISYRLGFDGFGWMEDAPMNRGVLDWLLALEWVQENIGKFGGNPERVTIAGQSAGGGAVLTLLGMEKAQQLFSQVYCISGAVADASMEKAEAFGRSMAKEAGIVPTKAAWQTIPEAKVLELQGKLTNLKPTQMMKMINEGLTLGPVIDGDLIERPTLESIKSGIGADKPLVIGSTDDEFTMITAEQDKVMKFVPKTALVRMAGLSGAARKQYFEDNPAAVNRSNAYLFGHILTDKMFHVFEAKAVEARGSAPTWVYRFSWPSGTFGFAEHCLDVPFFFDCLDGPAMEPLAGDNPPQALANEVHGDAVEFVKTGDPGWTPYSPLDQEVHVFDVPSSDRNDGFRSIRSLLS